MGVEERMPEETGAAEVQPGTDGGMAGDYESADREPGVPPREGPRIPHTSDELELVYRHALLAAATASGMKGEDIRILDMHELVTYTDYLVHMHRPEHAADATHRSGDRGQAQV